MDYKNRAFFLFLVFSQVPLTPFPPQLPGKEWEIFLFFCLAAKSGSSLCPSYFFLLVIYIKKNADSFYPPFFSPTFFLSFPPARKRKV